MRGDQYEPNVPMITKVGDALKKKFDLLNTVREGQDENDGLSNDDEQPNNPNDDEIGWE